MPGQSEARGVGRWLAFLRRRTTQRTPLRQLAAEISLPSGTAAADHHQGKLAAFGLYTHFWRPFSFLVNRVHKKKFSRSGGVYLGKKKLVCASFKECSKNDAGFRKLEHTKFHYDQTKWSSILNDGRHMF